MTRAAMNPENLQKTLDDICDTIRTPLATLHDMPAITDAQFDAIESILNTHQEVLYRTIFALITDADDRESALEAKIEELNEQVGETLSVVREAADRLPTVFILHDDAKRFGWHDRDEEAWNIITDLHAGIADACRAANIVA